MAAAEQSFDRWVGMEKEAWRTLGRYGKQLEQRLMVRGVGEGITGPGLLA